MTRRTAVARSIEPDAWDLKTVRTLLRRVYRAHRRDDNFGCHCAVMALNTHLHLVRMIVPQHPTRREQLRLWPTLWVQRARPGVLILERR